MHAVLLILVASVLFGTTGAAQAFGADGVDVVSLGAARIVVGGAGLALVALILARRGRGGRPGHLLAGSPAGRLGAAAIGALGVVAYQPAFFLGTESNGVAVGTLVALGSAPLLTGALSWILDRRFPGARWMIATVIAVIGLAVLGGAGAAQQDGVNGVDTIGLLGSLSAGLAYAVYTLASKRLLDAGWSGPSAMGAVFGGAAVIGVVVLATTDITWLATGSGLATVAWLGLATVLVAYLLFAAGLSTLSAPTVSTLTLAEPLTAALLGVAVIGERLSGPAWLGLAAITAGIAVLVLRPRRSAAAASPT